VARIRKRRDEYRVLVGKPEEKISHGRPRSRLDDNKMHLQEVRYGVEWTDLAHDMDRWQDLANALMGL
jgi:hypothetical protein